MTIKKINKSVELKSGKLKSKTFIVTKESLIHIQDMPFDLKNIIILSNIYYKNGIYTFTLKMMGYEYHNLKVSADYLTNQQGVSLINALSIRISEAIGKAIDKISYQFASEIFDSGIIYR